MRCVYKLSRNINNNNNNKERTQEFISRLPTSSVNSADDRITFNDEISH